MLIFILKQLLDLWLTGIGNEGRCGGRCGQVIGSSGCEGLV
jgi:hypothetical protein